jgi:hypothetical protein
MLALRRLAVPFGFANRLRAMSDHGSGQNDSSDPKVQGSPFPDDAVTLTPEAELWGLVRALPEEVTTNQGWLACPRGLEPPTFRSAT